MDFLNKVKDTTAYFEKELKTYADSLSDENLEGLIKSELYSLLAGGKRIRPLIAISFCRLFGGEDKGKEESLFGVFLFGSHASSF